VRTAGGGKTHGDVLSMWKYKKCVSAKLLSCLTDYNWTITILAFARLWPLYLKYWPLKMLSKTMWLKNWPYETSYGKTEFRCGFLAVENRYEVVSLDILWLLVMKLWQNRISIGGHLGFCQYGAPDERRLWRPQKMDSICPKQHLCQISSLYTNLHNSP